jgi:tetratricopeptide (TPR) repeat protein
MLGTPNRGSHSIPAMLIGRDALVKKLALLDLTHNYAELLNTITSFPGVLELLPYSGTLDLLTTQAWQTIHDQDVPSDRGLFSSSVESTKSAGFAWPQPAADALTAARAMRDALSNSPLDPARMLYVAGAADETACDVLVDANAPEGRRVRVVASAFGDGRVLWETGIPAGLPTYYMDAVHGDLANTMDAFPALLDLLTSGTTSKLPTTPPRRRSATSDTFEMREEIPAMVPDRDELVASALGGRRTGLTPTTAARSVAVRVVHDDLSNATAPVLVGHYKDDMIVGVEAYLDRQVSGRLSELRQMDLYPGAIGTAIVALNSTDSGNVQHPGAIVAGLGLVGDLTPGALVTTLTHALTVYGAERVGIERRLRQRRREGHPSSVLELSVSAVLVGSGETGVSLSDSVHALMLAVGAANSRLGATNVTTNSAAPELTAWIGTIEIVEIYSDRAIEAVHALRSLGRTSELEGLVINEFVTVRSGSRRRAYYDAPADWWQRIRVKSYDGGLQIEPLTRVARIPAILEPTSRDEVEIFLKDATGTTALDPSIGYTLFEILVPRELKAYAPDRRRLLLMLDPKAAALPWELLHDRFEQRSRPLAVASSMIRQLIDDHERPPALRATAKTALVVGNPVVQDPRFPTLAGATAEAEAVTSIFRSNAYDVTSLIGPDAVPRAVLVALHAKAWRILHLAAHGVFEFVASPSRPPVSGLVMGDGSFFTAAHASKLRYVPDLVFINCCHLGQTAGEPTAYHALAANLAAQFINMGARAVVAAGWAVHDGAAKAFAETLYGEMFAGEPFGEAVARARTRVYEEFGATNTWGAYQCYGDPAFSLVDSAKQASAELAVSEVEVLIAAEDITRSARTAAAHGLEALHRQLEATVRSVPESWWKSPALCAAIGEAYGDLGRFEEAISYYERITTANKADAPIRALEQLANLRVRWATDNGLKSHEAQRTAIDHLARAKALLQGLLAIGKTPERLNMMGSLWKRQAMLSRDATRRPALEAMRDSYAEALKLAREGGPKARAYPLANWLAAQVVLVWQEPHTPATPSDAVKAIEAGLIDLKAVATELATSSTDFWDLSAMADFKLLTALSACVLDAGQCEDVATEYIRAGLRGVLPRERASMLDQIVFYQLMAESEAPPDRLATLIVGLDDLSKTLAG